MKEEKRRKGTGRISRRQFLKDAGLAVGGVTVGSIGIVSACGGGTAQPEPFDNHVTNNVTSNETNNVTASVSNNVTGNVSNNLTNTVTPPVTPPPLTKIAETTNPPAAVDLELFNPAGNQEVTQLFAPRLSTLEGKTVAFLACDAAKWQPHRIFPVIMEELKKLYPTIKFLPMNEFTVGTSISNDDNINRVAGRMPDAVITGSAG